MFAAIAGRDGAVAGFGVMHFLSDSLALPRVGDTFLEFWIGDVERSFATLRWVKADVVMVVVED